MPNNDIHMLAVFAGSILLFYTDGLPPFLSLLCFICGAVVASFKRMGKVYGLSPDLDSFGIIKRLFAHRSIIFHSPIIPIIILNIADISFNCIDIWKSDPVQILIYGFCFGWLIHIIADGIQSMEWWDIPLKNTKKNTRLALGVICFIFTFITLLSIYFIDSGYLQIPILHDALVFFRNFILGIF
ncbi:MAG: hypothetical protein A7315_14825 [Candidatus Altiarchaeales archaeon WOR_SM1_79]|nr:MAG: hypothetical protein A7315_14825 [Candidatus Altiarchaeales archaeon WOR_SM1_79]